MGELAEHIVNHPFLATGFLALLAAVVFFEIRQRAQGQTQVGPAQAVRLMNAGAVVIDVRSAEDFRKGHIVNARSEEHTSELQSREKHVCRLLHEKQQLKVKPL